MTVGFIFTRLLLVLPLLHSLVASQPFTLNAFDQRVSEQSPQSELANIPNIDVLQECYMSIVKGLEK